jgi:hypothetical protein
MSGPVEQRIPPPPAQTLSYGTTLTEMPALSSFSAAY